MTGCIRLNLLGRERTITGGPFDAFSPPAIGLCLEERSRMAAQATILLPVADYGAPEPAALEAGLAALLVAMRAQPERAVYIGCRAGLGRTGMVIAALAKLAGEADPVGWTRQHYDPRAMETPAQEHAVAMLDAACVWRRVEAPG